MACEVDNERRVNWRSLVDWASDRVGRSGVAIHHFRLLQDNRTDEDVCTCVV